MTTASDIEKTYGDAPDTPASGKVANYTGNDKQDHILDDDGKDTNLVTGGVTAIVCYEGEVVCYEDEVVTYGV